MIHSTHSTCCLYLGWRGGGPGPAQNRVVRRHVKQRCCLSSPYHPPTVHPFALSLTLLETPRFYPASMNCRREWPRPSACSRSCVRRCRAGGRWAGLWKGAGCARDEGACVCACVCVYVCTTVHQSSLPARDAYGAYAASLLPHCCHITTYMLHIRSFSIGNMGLGLPRTDPANFSPNPPCTLLHASCNHAQPEPVLTHYACRSLRGWSSLRPATTCCQSSWWLTHSPTSFPC